MRNRLAPLSVVAMSLVLFGCGDRSTEPERVASPQFAVGGAAACPLPAGMVVTDEASLLAALAAASPGDVIGLDGFFEVTADVLLTTNDVTLTCASPGSGLFAQPGGGVVWLIQALADGVAVDRLTLDGGATTRGPFFGNGAQGVRLANNTVTCGPGECAFFVVTPGAAVLDNRFESSGSVTGVHLQGNTDGARIEGNTIVTTASQTISVVFGGIRPRDGTGVTVLNNDVHGPWNNSIHATAVTTSHFKGNTLTAAALDGMLLTALADNVFRNNNARAAGEAGLFVQSACGNVFVGNNLQGNANDLGAYFAAATGANTLVGNKNVVADNGNFDCDGDGVVDPNIITGPGRAKSGVKLGKIVSDAVSSGPLK